MFKNKKKENTINRARRVRFKLKKVAYGKPRLSVFRSNQHIYAQVIDDEKGVTLAAASTKTKEIRDSLKGFTIESAKKVGEVVAKKALEKGVKEVLFDKGAYLFHGKVKALAEGARKSGLKF
jgi:large subunit ribosomal protein L18